MVWGMEDALEKALTRVTKIPGKKGHFVDREQNQPVTVELNYPMRFRTACGKPGP